MLFLIFILSTPIGWIGYAVSVGHPLRIGGESSVNVVRSETEPMVMVAKG